MELKAEDSIAILKSLILGKRDCHTGELRRVESQKYFDANETHKRNQVGC